MISKNNPISRNNPICFWVCFVVVVVVVVAVVAVPVVAIRYENLPPKMPPKKEWSRHFLQDDPTETMYGL